MCDLKTIYRVQIYVRTISKKKKKTGKPKTYINTTVYLWENLLKLPSFSSHKAWQKPSYSTMTTVQSGFIWTCWKLQRQLHVMHYGFTEINVKHCLTDCSKGSKSNHTDTLLCDFSTFFCEVALSQKISRVFWKYTPSSVVHVRFGWCLVDDVQVGTISVLHLQSNEIQKQSSLCVATIKTDAHMSGDIGSEVDKQFPYLFFPF